MTRPIMRLFFAIELDDAVRATVADTVADLGVRVPWRWVDRDNLHVTLKFLGEMQESALPELHAIGEAVAQRHEVFHVQLGALGGFPKLDCARVLFYALEQGARPMQELAAMLDRALHVRMDVESELRPFRAHVTIARVKSAFDDEIRAALAGAPVLQHVAQDVLTFSLMKSTLGPQGARYQRLKEFALKKSK